MTDASYSPGTEIPDVTSASGKTALKRAGLSIGAMLTGIYGLGAVATYRPDDPSLNVATDEAARNLFGGPGAMFADILVQSIGAAAPVAMGAVFAAGAIRIMRKRMTASVLRERLLAGVGGIALLAGAASAAPTPGFWPLAAGFGGVVGDGIAGLLTTLFSLPGLPAAGAFAGLTAGVGGALALGWAFSVKKQDMASAMDRAADAAFRAGGLAKGAYGAVSAKLRRPPEPWELQNRALDRAPPIRQPVLTAVDEGFGAAADEPLPEAPRPMPAVAIRRRAAPAAAPAA
ncbi:MAG: DNA translocase FtsK 4TM domain-containing protein, partial [Hyphomonadaceae bacterium]|nr:DNA translocase FtsK 4TM domain-containing protein [Hyphomonadaceae bacterium]